MRPAAPALVVGGGVAGAAVAAHLAQAGRAVVLVERRDGPHHKVCGEFVSGEAALYLDDLGVDLAALGAVRMRAVRLCAGRRAATASLPFPAFSLSRRVLDEALLAAATERGAEIRRGRGVRALARRDTGWLAELDDGETVAADEVFLATGKHDLRGWKRPPGVQHDLVAFKLHWRLSPDQAAELGSAVELTLFSGGYAGLEPVENGVANLCLVVRRRHLAALAHVPAKACPGLDPGWAPVRRPGHAPTRESGADPGSLEPGSAPGQRWDALLAALRAGSPQLDRRLTGARACWSRPLAIASIPYGHVATGDGPWRLGDQAAVIPSFAGDGIAIALHSARLAADIHLAGGGAAEFQSRLACDVAEQVRRATLVSRMLVHPAGQVVAALVAGLVPGVVAGVAQRTRIPAPCLRSARHLPLRHA